MLIIAFSLEIINFELHNLIIVLAYHLLQRRPNQISKHTFYKVEKKPLKNIWQDLETNDTFVYLLKLIIHMHIMKHIWGMIKWDKSTLICSTAHQESSKTKASSLLSQICYLY